MFVSNAIHATVNRRKLKAMTEDIEKFEREKDRVIPLATKIVELLRSESDSRVGVAALQCVLMVPDYRDARKKVLR